MKRLDSLFSALAGHRGLEWDAAGRQEAVGAKSQRGSQERHFGESQGVGVAALVVFLIYLFWKYS